MKIFGKTLFENKKTATEVVNVNDGKMSFSTPFFKIGKGDLGKPFISSWYTISGIVQFGSENLYPQILDQMYYTSPMHSGCLEFISRAAIGGGFEYTIPPVTGVEKVDLYTFEKKNKFKKIFRYLPIDFLIHKRVCMLIRKDVNGKFVSMTKLNPATIRNNQTVDKFIYCNDWSRRTDLIQFNKYTPNGKDLESLWVYQAETVGQDTYPLPSYISVLNDVFLDGEISYLQKSNIQNSIWPSLSIRVPKMFESDAERESFKQGLIDNSGASGAGKIIIMQGQGFDNTPEVTSIPTNQNDKLFDSTIENILNKICFAHGINPSIMGIKVAGGMGNDAELEMSYSIFEKNVIMPLRDELTEIYDALLDIAGVKNSIVINDYQIISGGATSATEEPSLADKLGIGGTQTLVSILSDALLTKDQKVNAVMLLYNMPIEDAKKLVYGSEDAVAAAAAAPMAVDQLSTEPAQTNDAIKNMTGRQHQQLLRIIRQFGQGKINKEQAAVLLRTGLGLSESDINLMLNESE